MKEQAVRPLDPLAFEAAANSSRLQGGYRPPFGELTRICTLRTPVACQLKVVRLQGPDPEEMASTRVLEIENHATSRSPRFRGASRTNHAWIFRVIFGGQ